MNRSMALLAALAVPALANAQPASNPTVAAPRLQRGVEDPRRFVLETYEAFARSEESLEWPAQSYSPRLQALFADYEAWTAAQDGLIGELDFDWWVNAQDWGIADVGVSEWAEARDRRIERVRFLHGDRRDEIRLVFVREEGRWYLDEAIEGSGGDGDGWTLSELLRARPE